MKPVNRKIVIGDIHGCFSELKALLNKVEFNKKYDELYLLGDLVDRGPQIKETVQFAIETKNTFIVQGNHDYRLHRYVLGNYNKAKTFNLHTTLIQYKDDELLLQKHCEWLKNQPLFYDFFYLVLVHASWKPEVYRMNSQQKIDLCCYDRESIKWYRGDSVIVYGHEGYDEIKFGTYVPGKINTIGLDTGCCFGRKLSCAIFEDDKLVKTEEVKSSFSIRDSAVWKEWHRNLEDEEEN